MLLDPETAAEHRSRLVDVASSICGSRALAEDLVQETYARVLTKPRPLREGAVFPYLVRALRNVAKDHWRAEQRRPQVIGDLDPEDPRLRHDREPHHEVVAQEVYAHVERLPNEFRDVVKAVDVLGLSYAQAAGTLRIPQGTVMSRLSRGRRRLACAMS
ncbi:RNA polymerase sigma factor [Solirubrobacter sp. CPCC 204708]|uniref:RNA polymerase sigma factor n=1 Tax=Solirubrobacter deserti TaxID=2282478 RepID=A0ABT4RH48_9ACTN|nr:RNA polymerase sigma factor [Solirubrobacter deserti]MBE2319611.1 RNA polymerase sigma factor [Solirubrobacter deserti]MDA0137650.1 RNA polymerase sigma factor [Solirubrobacter deserti]